MTSPPDDDYGAMSAALRAFLDQLSSARPAPELLREMAATLGKWSDDLEAYQVPEPEWVFGYRRDLPGGGHTGSPVLTITGQTATELRGTVRFSRYFNGRGAAHGGFVSLVWDEVLGRITQMDGPKVARTAYLHVNYRSITPIDRDLRVTARLVSVNGRKRVAAGEMHDGDVLCSDAEGLFVELRPGQPLPVLTHEASRSSTSLTGAPAAMSPRSRMTAAAAENPTAPVSLPSRE